MLILSNELLKQIYKLGYEVRFTGKNGDFELAHISRQQIEAFSKRMLKIQEQAKDIRGRDYQQLQRIIAEKSRDKKTKVDHIELRQVWDKTAKEFNLNLTPKLELNQELQAKINENNPINKNDTILQVIDWTINHHIERESAIKKSDILVTAINQSQGKISYLEIKDYIEELIKKKQIIESKPLYVLYGSKSQEYKSQELKQIVENIANNQIQQSYTQLQNQLDTIQEIKKDEVRYKAIAQEYTNSLIKNEDVILIVG